MENMGVAGKTVGLKTCYCYQHCVIKNVRVQPNDNRGDAGHSML